MTTELLSKLVKKEVVISTSEVHLSGGKNNCELNLSGDVFHQNSAALSDRSISLMSPNIKSALRLQKTLFFLDSADQYGAWV